MTIEYIKNAPHSIDKEISYFAEVFYGKYR